MVYLCGRPLPNRGRCVMGRETAIEKMVWGEDGWLRTTDGQGVPHLDVTAPNLRYTNSRPSRSVTISMRPTCRSPSSGCARHIRKTCSV